MGSLISEGMLGSLKGSGGCVPETGSRTHMVLKGTSKVPAEVFNRSQGSWDLRKTVANVLVDLYDQRNVQLDKQRPGLIHRGGKSGVSPAAQTREPLESPRGGSPR